MSKMERISKIEDRKFINVLEKQDGKMDRYACQVFQFSSSPKLSVSYFLYHFISSNYCDLLFIVPALFQPPVSGHALF